MKTVPQLLDTYYNSIGRNATFLLNFRSGLMARFTRPTKHVIEMNRGQTDLRRESGQEGEKWRQPTSGRGAKKWPAERRGRKRDTYWATDDNLTTASLTIELKKPRCSIASCAGIHPTRQRVKGFTEALVTAIKELATAPSDTSASFCFGGRGDSGSFQHHRREGRAGHLRHRTLPMRR